MKHSNAIDDTQKRWPIAAILMAIAAILFFYTGHAWAADAGGATTGVGLASVANNIVETLGPLAKLITAGAYVAGFGFAVGAILKFKAHKDNPTQIPVGTPIALIFIAAALIFLPNIFTVTGKTMFGTQGGEAGGIGGVTTFTGAIYDSGSKT